jgi:hypothetical protein
VLTTEFLIFIYHQVGSGDLRISGFGRRRIYRIERLLGAETLQPVLEDVYKQLSKEHPRAWSIFLNGDDAERQAVQEEVQLR